MNDKHTFEPDWIETPPEPGTYRSIFKWGAPERFRHPDTGFLSVIKEELNLSRHDVGQKKNTGREKVTVEKTPALSADVMAALTEIAGRENISFSDYDRLKYASGKSMADILKLRLHVADHIPDAVVHPAGKACVEEIVSFCSNRGIPVHTYGGGSSVTLGLQCTRGGVTLVMGTHMNRIIDFNETNQTITVEPGIMGPAYEDALNRAPERFNTERRYTGGHFPQSFEFSSVGGWVAALGSGQCSSYYGDACDLVMSQEVVTPAGTVKTRHYPAAATGPKVNDMLKGSEGTFGVLVSVTMKVFRYLPGNRQMFAFMMPSWAAAVNAAREISQAESGMPSVLRISDPEETETAMKMYGIQGTLPDRLMRFRCMKKSERALLIGQADGEKQFAKNIKKQVRKICRQHGGMYLTGYPVKKWHRGRFSDPYLREDLNDVGILIDTLETSVTWDTLHRVHTTVRDFIKVRGHTICMTHASHFYPQGTNLYFIFITRAASLEDYREFQEGIIASIVKSGGSLSHHHGVGRMMAPWMETHLGKEQMAVLRALKNHFDPNGIMNPGGTLGLDR